MFQSKLGQRRDRERFTLGELDCSARLLRPFSLWLMPSGAIRNALFTIVSKFSSEYDSPLFEPHVTTLSGLLTAGEQTTALLAAACRGRAPISLRIRGVEHSSLYYKCVYIALHPSQELLSLVRASIALLDFPAEDFPEPHLSLLYKEMPEDLRAQLATEVKLQCGELVFDRVQVVWRQTYASGDADVLAWECAGVQALQEGTRCATES